MKSNIQNQYKLIEIEKVTFEELDEEEKHAIIQGREDFKNGDTFSDDEIDWDNLDKMNLE